MGVAPVAFVGAPLARGRGGVSVCWHVHGARVCATAEGPRPKEEDGRLRAPNDATPLRSESEVRRNAPARRVPRRRRRRASPDPVLEWDKLESVPLVGGDRAEEGWVDLRSSAEQAQKERDEEERRRRSMEKVQPGMKEKLKKEVVQPYEQNWIGIVVVVIAVLAVAFKLSGGFETIPVIQVPDL